MHLLATASGTLDGNAEAVDLKQSPGEVLFLSAADSELALLSRAYRGSGGIAFSLRLANILQLQHNLSVDLYLERMLRTARVIVVRLLGGRSYWSYGIERLVAEAKERGISLCILPGGMDPDPESTALSTIPASHCERMRQYLIAGGLQNAESFLRYIACLLHHDEEPVPAQPLPKAGVYKRPKQDLHSSAAILFYKSVVEGGQTEPIDHLIDQLESRGIAVTAIFVSSLKDRESVDVIHEALSSCRPDLMVNATSFAVAGGHLADPLHFYDCPVVQVVLSMATEEGWLASSQGMGPQDLAMNVVLPEIDGRLLSRAISFKSNDHWDQATECRIAGYRGVADRISFVADLIQNWIRLRKAPPPERKLALVLANYPNKDGRIANGVGYDTPESTVRILEALSTANYTVTGAPKSGGELMAQLTAGRTNARSDKSSSAILSLNDYLRFFSSLPDMVRAEVVERWGSPETDPFFLNSAFQLPVLQFGNVVVGIQPARGYNIDPKATYHDPALVPPHGYLAFYFWIRKVFGAHAVVHNGKHGNLEWLPGKAVLLSDHCYPEVAFGPLPHFYPFIVNDPGEGTQAKRRSSAVIIDHLTPPLARAETYGPLKDLEALVDEYYLASGLDRRRLDGLRRDILEISQSHRLDVDAGFTGEAEADLQRLDAFLCDLKEAQIRDGLHILGQSPQGQQENELLVALLRVPRGIGEGRDASLLRALASSMGLSGFDPLNCVLSSSWSGPKPPLLQEMSADPWRTAGDTLERLEQLAVRLVSMSDREVLALFKKYDLSVAEELQVILKHVEEQVRPILRSCGDHEMRGLIAGLDGKLVQPGPSGAPTRGRLDVLPTGRNFFSLDSRSVPTPMAWNLGLKSAEQLLLRHFQDNGCYPRAIGLTAWGTSNMRTGGDDIAQALALIGVKPVWEPSSWRVTGFEIVPVSKLGRPRVDVTLRISGFFRDAFPAQIELLDKSIRAVGMLDEDGSDNPLAERMRTESDLLRQSGLSDSESLELAGARIFGSKPGAYGAGLQALIDERIWSERPDLAHAYVTWGAYAYGARLNGRRDETLFRERLSRIEAVVHNQDNREHDLLDSDDYYQFEGGMSAAVEQASGSRPRVYHNDHSRPETPVIRTLEEEISRVVRSRVVNPKWIDGVRRHGYKGAFEIAATIDYMFAFAATTGAVKSHHFDLAFDAFLADEEVREFIARNNPAALREIAERLEEAVTRGLWTPRLNSAYHVLREMTQ
jgi:cobaltochelatase CobN